MSKAKRLLQLIDKMQSGQKFTVRQLAEEFEVSYRTMLRDLQEVGELGVPLYSESGAHGGYQLLKKDMKAIQPDKSFCRIIQVPTFHAVGFSYAMPLPASGEAEVLIPRLWLLLEQRIAEIRGVMDRRKRTSVICHSAQEAVVHVCYEVQQPCSVPSGMVGLTVPGRSYLIYAHKGSMDRANRLRTGQRATEWIRRAGIEVDSTLSVEWYDDNVFDPFSPTNAFHFLRATLAGDPAPIKLW